MLDYVQIWIRYAEYARPYLHNHPRLSSVFQKRSPNCLSSSCSSWRGPFHFRVAQIRTSTRYSEYRHRGRLCKDFHTYSRVPLHGLASQYCSAFRWPSPDLKLSGLLRGRVSVCLKSMVFKSSPNIDLSTYVWSWGRESPTTTRVLNNRSLTTASEDSRLK